MLLLHCIMLKSVLSWTAVETSWVLHDDHQVKPAVEASESLIWAEMGLHKHIILFLQRLKQPMLLAWDCIMHTWPSSKERSTRTDLLCLFRCAADWFQDRTSWAPGYQVECFVTANTSNRSQGGGSAMAACTAAADLSAAASSPAITLQWHMPVGNVCID